MISYCFSYFFFFWFTQQCAGKVVFYQTSEFGPPPPSGIRRIPDSVFALRPPAILLVVDPVSGLETGTTFGGI